MNLLCYKDRNKTRIENIKYKTLHIYAYHSEGGRQCYGKNNKEKTKINK